MRAIGVVLLALLLCLSSFPASAQQEGGGYLDALYCRETVHIGSVSPFDSGSCQLWQTIYDHNHDGWFRLQLKRSGKYLDLRDCKDQLGFSEYSSYRNGGCQLWAMDPLGAGGWFRLRLMDNNRYLDACTGSITLRPLQLGGNCQLWRFVDVAPVKPGFRHLQLGFVDDKR